jgi:hypothetical protein
MKKNFTIICLFIIQSTLVAMEDALGNTQQELPTSFVIIIDDLPCLSPWSIDAPLELPSSFSNPRSQPNEDNPPENPVQLPPSNANHSNPPSQPHAITMRRKGPASTTILSKGDILMARCQPNQEGLPTLAWIIACNICDEECESVEQLNAHLACHIRELCPACNKKLYKSYLRAHIARKHPEAADQK